MTAMETQLLGLAAVNALFYLKVVWRRAEDQSYIGAQYTEGTSDLILPF
jgi:hypothetical protein